MIQFQLPLLLCVVVVEWYNDVEGDKMGRTMKEVDCVFDVLSCYMLRGTKEVHEKLWT
jgi:hypothetical protein